MKIIVTGGAGFIGSSLTHFFLDERNSVMPIDDFSTGLMENIHPWAHFRKLDIFDPTLPQVFKDFEPDAIIHLAGQASVPKSLRDPEGDWQLNVEGTRAVALAVKAANAKRMILASSTAVYGEAENMPFSEDHVCDPISPYGHSMLAAEFVLDEELKDSQVDYAAFRISNVYGPKQNYHEDAGVITQFCHDIAMGTSPTIFGDGKQTRDFLYVGDVVNAISLALAHEGKLANEQGFVYNISTGTASSIEIALLQLRAASFFMGVPDYVDAREGDLIHNVADPKRAQSVFGWTPFVTIERGLDTTWNWLKKVYGNPS